MITVTRKNQGAESGIAVELLNRAISYYMHDVKNGTKYLDAEQVKGLGMKELVDMCIAEQKWHVGLVRKIVSAIGENSYRKSVAYMNGIIEKYAKENNL